METYLTRGLDTYIGKRKIKKMEEISHPSQSRERRGKTEKC